MGIKHPIGMLKDKIYPASCLLPLEYTEPCAWKSLKFHCPGGWVGHKKNCCNTPFAGINSVLSKATMLIPSKSRWSIKKPLSLCTYGVGRIRKTKEFNLLAAALCTKPEPIPAVCWLLSESKGLVLKHTLVYTALFLLQQPHEWSTPHQKSQLRHLFTSLLLLC